MFVTTEEFNTVYRAGIRSFADATYQELITKLYSLESTPKMKSRLKFLLLYALNTYRQDQHGTPLPDNILSPGQVMTIYSKLKEL